MVRHGGPRVHRGIPIQDAYPSGVATATITSPRPGRARSRRGPGWVPNQHGAWAMLATPLLVGILAAGPRWVHLPLTLFWFTGYFAFFATGLWLKSRRRRRYLPPVRAYGLATLVLGAVTAALDPALSALAPLFVVPLGVGLAASAARHDRALVSGLTTSLGSCLMTLVAYAAGGGTDTTRAWLLTAVLFAYFGGTVVYVKTMIRERDSVAHYLLSVGWHAVAVVVLAPVGTALAAVFVVLTIRAAMAAAFALSPKAVGIAEAVATVVVALSATATIG